MLQVIYNTLGRHPLLHTEAHEITHLSHLRPALTPAHAHNFGRARGLAVAPPRPDLPGPGAAS
eukprot:1556313-Prymnesium_polylepis.1